ncbi:hypothetical protein [Dyadobacter arcticus]|uniref:HEAT repeat-containing protein n=1 Tax=Dyadobacter arcticus TaxID=1078754 RepID=A0ABX0UNY2_9BACT|nr:hypothetical protein [Dyadobacter arcticus]NIJ53395.1 hypothetical protein [Dyadobacter arcticus]
MNIKSELLAEPLQSKRVAIRVADYACTSADAFEALMHCFLAEDSKLSQRAAYSLGIAAVKVPHLVQPYVGQLVSQLKKTGSHDALNRNITRIFEVIPIPEEFHGEVIDACFGFLENRLTAIAIRAYSLTILFNFSKIYPEIKTELRFLIEESLHYEKPAFVSRGRKILTLI